MINIVLYKPEIPQNTGNIMRTAAATNAVLHLIKPLGFSLDEKYLRRSSTNHIEDIELKIYENIEDFFAKNNGTYYFITRYGQKNYTDFNYESTDENIYFIFGQESSGIPKEILRPYLDTCLRIPTTNKVRSLNISNCAAVIVFEALRQQNFHELELLEPHKGIDFINED